MKLPRFLRQLISPPSPKKLAGEVSRALGQGADVGHALQACVTPLSRAAVRRACSASEQGPVGNVAIDLGAELARSWRAVGSALEHSGLEPKAARWLSRRLDLVAKRGADPTVQAHLMNTVLQVAGAHAETSFVVPKRLDAERLETALATVVQRALGAALGGGELGQTLSDLASRVDGQARLATART